LSNRTRKINFSKIHRRGTNDTEFFNRRWTQMNTDW
jgi:hypothetical protein